MSAGVVEIELETFPYDNTSLNKCAAEVRIGERPSSLRRALRRSNEETLEQDPDLSQDRDQEDPGNSEGKAEKTPEDPPVESGGSDAFLRGLDAAKEIDTEIPDSGWRAWLVVLGAFCANITTTGFVNSSGTIQEYLLTHQLSDKSESTVGWIFSLYIFFLFFCGIQTGPLVDTFGIKPILLPGCILWCASLMITSAFTEYYQFILGFSLLGGVASSLIFNPSYTVISQWFTSKRPVALSFVAIGGSVAGSFLPIVLSSLFDSVGYGWTIRTLAFIFIGLSIIACLTMHSRKKTPKKFAWKDVSIDLTSLRAPNFSWCVLALLLAEWAYFLPSMYIVDVAKVIGYSNRDSNLLLVYMNIGSTVGRLGSGYTARYYGSFNSMIGATAFSGLASLCIWLPAGTTRGGLTAFSVVFGIFSGAGMSLGPSCVAIISNSTNFGRRYGTTYALISLAVLTSMPIGGLLTGNNYQSMKIVTGVVYLVASAATLVARTYSHKILQNI